MNVNIFHLRLIVNRMLLFIASIHSRDNSVIVSPYVPNVYALFA